MNNYKNTMIRAVLKRTGLLIFILMSYHSMTICQAQKVVIDPSLNEVVNNYLNRQAAAFLSDVKKTITTLHPQYPLPRERYLSLLLLDAVLHDVYAAQRPAVQDFFTSQIKTSLEEIENTTVGQGAKIWKLYNMGFIVRTKSITIAFDLVTGESAQANGFTLSDDTMARFVKQCDALFISHRHRDHKDIWVAEQFIELGKPVVAPPQVWEGLPIHEKITHLKREAHTIQKLPLKGKNLQLDVVVYPGHQMSSHENNVSLIISPEGISFAQMGDQINEGDFMIDYEWIDKVSEHHNVDILLPPSWTNEIYRIVKGFNPKLVIPGHENELGHTVDDRVPFWDDSEYLELTYPELKASEYPLVIMTWGESYH
ncbi:MAG: MBL fold metallo-hydrolase, partial [Cyclobacteriaceae bacterium]|nr:MBL fold metallo-hydrolase [Cyclobacteriaceae bacterium]